MPSAPRVSPCLFGWASLTVFQETSFGVASFEKSSRSCTICCGPGAGRRAAAAGAAGSDGSLTRSAGIRGPDSWRAALPRLPPVWPTGGE
eukprot:2146615-Pyramimonas_sp.AAC.1